MQVEHISSSWKKLSYTWRTRPLLGLLYGLPEDFFVPFSFAWPLSRPAVTAGV
ncbi:hypothetical protein ACSS6W_006022 [Trichoderma asperelloides]